MIGVLTLALYGIVGLALLVAAVVIIGGAVIAVLEHRQRLDRRDCPACAHRATIDAGFVTIDEARRRARREPWL